MKISTGQEYAAKIINTKKLSARGEYMLGNCNVASGLSLVCQTCSGGSLRGNSFCFSPVTPQTSFLFLFDSMVFHASATFARVISVAARCGQVSLTAASNSLLFSVFVIASSKWPFHDSAV